MSEFRAKVTKVAFARPSAGGMTAWCFKLVELPFGDGESSGTAAPALVPKLEVSGSGIEDFEIKYNQVASPFRQLQVRTPTFTKPVAE
jgi:hypothetical protein